MKKALKTLWIGLGLALLLRLAIALLPSAFDFDLYCFKEWTAVIVKEGVGGLYLSKAVETACDYPPLYMHFLWLWGTLYQSLFDPALHIMGWGFNFWMKIPPILADIGCAYLVYRILEGKVAEPWRERATLFFAFNPLFILDSAAWGQLDLVLTLGLLLSAWCLLEDRFLLACLLATASILLKPQGIFFAPLLLFHQWDRQPPWRWGVAGLSCLALSWGVFAAAVPRLATGWAVLWQPFVFFFDRMHGTALHYPFSTVNAFNIWSPTGGFLPDTRLFLGISHASWGLGLMSLLLLGLFLLLRKKRDPLSFFHAGAVLQIGCFLLLTRMHERYILPGIVFLALAAAIRPALNRVYWGFVATSFLNVLWVFLLVDDYRSGVFLLLGAGFKALVVLANLALFVYLLKPLFSRSGGQEVVPAFGTAVEQQIEGR